MPISRRTFCLSGASLLATAASGCGTILYPERKGQPAGRLDWQVVALDTIGLLLFFIPGVIAFAVDFNNGTIYLPPDEYGKMPEDGDSVTLKTVAIGKPQPSPAEVEAAILKETSVAVKLDDTRLRSKAVRSIDDFWHDVRSLSRIG